MLRRWRDTTSSIALYRDLYRALCHNRVGLDNVAKEFCGKEKPKMYFLRGLLTIRAKTNFEADGRMKKNAECKLWFSPVRCKALFSDCYEIIPICYGFIWRELLLLRSGPLNEGLQEKFVVNFGKSRQIHTVFYAYLLHLVEKKSDIK